MKKGRCKDRSVYDFELYYVLSHVNIYITIYDMYYMNKASDEHSHHPVCEACGKEFQSVHDLTVHIDKEHQHKY